MKIIKIIIALLAIPLKAYSQQLKIIDKYKYRCEYALTHQMDSTDISSLNNEIMILEIGEKASKFYSLGFHLRDSIERNTDKNILYSSQSNPLFRNVPSTKHKTIILKDRSKQALKVYEKLVSNYYTYEEDLYSFKWNIEQETKEVSGYSCQKATTWYMGRTYIAWFTHELPITDGPYKFNGLPGLIINISDTRNHYTYELISFKKVQKQKDIYIYDDAYIKTTLPQITKTKREFYNNFFKKIEANGAHIEFENPADKKRVADNLKKSHNNAIELFSN